MARLPRATDQRATANSLQWWFTAALMLGSMLIIGGAYRYFRVDPRIIEARKTQAEHLDKVFAQDGKEPDLDERQAMFTAMRDKMAALPEAERQQLQQENRENFIARVQQQEAKRLGEFFALSTGPERVAYLAHYIDKYEARQKARANERAERDDIEARADSGIENRADSDIAPPGPTGSNLSGTGATSGSWADLTHDQRKARARQRLNSTTPEYRTQPGQSSVKPR